MAFLVQCVFIILYLIPYSVCYEDISGPTHNKRSELHPALDFSRHTLVRPRIYHGREKRQISTTRGRYGEHVTHLMIELNFDEQQTVLDLVQNKDLIPKGFFQKHQENGTYKTHIPSAQDVDLCHYNGKVRGKPNSWAALSTCYGLSGVFFDGSELHYVEYNANNNAISLDDTHILYKHSDLAEHNKTCGYDGQPYNFKHSHKDNRILRYKRATESSELIRGPYNANKESKFVELVLVVDNREFKELGESRSKVVNHCKNIANIINALYSPLNIFIALVGVVIWSEHDEISFSENGDTTLTNFLHYRREQLVKNHPNDNAQLLTKFNFENGVVGKALKGPICTYQYSGGVNTDHSPVVGLVATTVAHEMGHNFGMEHDTNECKCPDDRCIMAPSSSAIAPTHWSSCSLNYLLLAFTHGMDYCLKNKPKSLFDSPVCGNGFVEPGEQCDCGLPEHCDNYCCDAASCMLYSNASCATGECCDLSTCKPKNAGILCRSADYECDLPEFCTGQSEYCPSDIYKLDTEVCDGGKAFCYHGFCRTRTDQCKLLWGETGISSDDQCYEMNKKGTRHGNCGYNQSNQSFFKCDTESVLCGMLHCKHFNERLEFGMESVSILSHTFLNKKGSLIACRTAIVDLGINDIDPGMTPDGAKCGDGKMCVNQTCMTVSSLRKDGPNCPKNCNGNGWCNNLGHCHCMDGYAPPFCDYPGPGGSEDSGPASDPNARQGVVTAMYIIFLGIVPFTALIALLFYYSKNNLTFGWKKSGSIASKSPSKSRGSSFPSEATKKSEDNHSLLKEDSIASVGLQNDFFGNFKGFSLLPLKKADPEPHRSAPPPPAAQSTSPNKIVTGVATISTYNKTPPPAPTVVTYNKPAPAAPNMTIKKSNPSILTKVNNPAPVNDSGTINSLKSGISAINTTSTVPALPPPNQGSNPRPIISSPVLESSTSNAKELVSPLKNAVKVHFRTEVSNHDLSSSRPRSTHDVVIHNVVQEKKIKDKELNGNSALNRIASFLKPSDKKPLDSLQKSNQGKANKILDKKTLRNLEISKPIPQSDIELAVATLPLDSETNRNVVMRAQSMRTAKPTQRPNIQTFGSMRQASGPRRPLSIPSANRPKNPPPPRPLNCENESNHEDIEKIDQNEYDDCLNKVTPIKHDDNSNGGDNIYAVIEESPVLSPVKSSSNSCSNESMGLLGEIVSEIQNRNFDSIYSTSTLNRKRKAKEKNDNENVPSLESNTYVNTSESIESQYSNMNNMKSCDSSSSSGYIHPSAVNAPLKLPDKKSESKDVVKTNFSTFRSNSSPAGHKPPPPPQSLSRIRTPSPNSFQKTTSVGDKSTKSAKQCSPTSKTPAKPAPSRQITPPNLRTRKPSPTRPLSQNIESNRSVTNSPDLVTSCSSNASPKGPDVVNGGIPIKKPVISNSKPITKKSIKTNTVNLKSLSDKKSEAKPPVATKLTKAKSDVASKTASVGVKNAAKQNSNVASLQQKFENKDILAAGKSKT